jgi:hypothetical protein
VIQHQLDATDPTTWPDADDAYPVAHQAARAPESPSAESETPDMEIPDRS